MAVRLPLSPVYPGGTRSVDFKVLEYPRSVIWSAATAGRHDADIDLPHTHSLMHLFYGVSRAIDSCLHTLEFMAQSLTFVAPVLIVFVNDSARFCVSLASALMACSIRSATANNVDSAATFRDTATHILLATQGAR